MKPTLGWTMLSREEMRQAEKLTSGDQDTRDEIGFLLIHQGFADRFFPGTSVLHTRVRYALFVPWLFKHAAKNKPRGSDLGAPPPVANVRTQCPSELASLASHSAAHVVGTATTDVIRWQRAIPQKFVTT